MPVEISKIAEHFKELEIRLKEKSPEQLRIAEELVSNLKDSETAGIDECWRVMWDKPLYANNKVTTVDKQVERIAPYMLWLWKTAWLPGEGFVITKIGKQGKAEDFIITWPVAQKLSTDCRIAAKRLYAIQGAAIALRKRFEISPNAPYAGLIGKPLIELVEAIRGEMWWGWGGITTLHFLTDIGLACKPDIHLVRTAKVLGMVSGLGDDIPNITQSISINDAIKSLSVALYRDESPRHIRYLDKLLMEFSRQELL